MTAPINSTINFHIDVPDVAIDCHTVTGDTWINVGDINDPVRFTIFGSHYQLRNFLDRMRAAIQANENDVDLERLRQLDAKQDEREHSVDLDTDSTFVDNT